MRVRVLSVATLCLALGAHAWAFAPEEGLASWYGGKFHGRRTASGEIFDTNKFTAAHKTLPFGTLVLVTNLDNGKTAVVRINDRGPFVAGRIIDLSRAAAAAIGMTGKGVAPVRIEPASPDAAPATFCVQLGAFRARPSADRLLARLTEAGFPALVEESGAGIYRVLIAGVAEKDLEATRRTLREAGFADQLVRPEPQSPAADS
jgi:rare lipoprotein A